MANPTICFEYYLDDSWADHLRRFERYTAEDAGVRERRLSFHIGDQAPRVTRYVAESVTR